MPNRTLPESAAKLHGLVESLAHECRDWLAHNPALGKFVSTNPRLDPETRRRLAFLEDAQRKADHLVK